MELIIIRHAESGHNAKLTDDLDSDLTNIGINQAVITGKWIEASVDRLQEFECLISPYLRVLTTTECLELPIRPKIVPELREFYINPTQEQIEDGGIFIQSNYTIFDDYEWDKTAMGYFFKNESIDEFFDRVRSFLDTLHPNGKYIIISHGATCRTIHAMAANKDLSELRARYENPNHEFLDSIKNSSITWVKDGETILFSETVWEGLV